MNSSERLVSLDAFRGFTIAAMILVNFPAVWGQQYSLLLHAKWHGITPPDFIFPFFLFIIGVSITFSYSKQIAAGRSKPLMIKKIIIRSVNLFVVGILLRLLPNFDIGNIELPGVLQRIAFVFLICAILFLVTNWKVQSIIGLGLLIGYWITMQFLPVPEIGIGVLEPGKNMAAWVDRIVIPASLLNSKGFDSDGFFSSFPAIANCIAGMLTGHFLLSKRNNETKLIWLFVAGVILILVGQIWNWNFPINKKIWTSSFVLYTTGWAVAIFAVLIWFVDVQGFQKWSKFGVVFGSNAIAIYVLADVYETIFLHSSIRSLVYSSLVQISVNPKMASLMWALISVVFCYLTALLFYRKKIFIKL